MVLVLKQADELALKTGGTLNNPDRLKQELFIVLNKVVFIREYICTL